MIVQKLLSYWKIIQSEANWIEFKSDLRPSNHFIRNMSSQVSSQVEAALKRIQSHKGVVGTIVVNSEGIPLRTDLDNSNTLLHASLCKALVSMANNTVRDIDPENELTILRVKSKKNELIISPWDDYLLIVIQNNNEWMAGDNVIGPLQLESGLTNILLKKLNYEL